MKLCGHRIRIHQVHLIGVRDSKKPTGPALVFTPGEWYAFTAGVQGGEFNRPTA
ncbi:DUF397 domain-containing protein [Nocardia sp. NBC_01730]|uniref:DUF397 domain-containing protein n=1 Tax=Nocardia sp. NBC_01730 TaxID=2975998 RepID=UPI003FA354EA